MKPDNSLTSAFLTRFPDDAARVLELMPSREVAAFFDDLPPEAIARVVEAMLPVRAVTCLDHLDLSVVEDIMSVMATVPAARILRHFGADKRKQVIAKLPSTHTSAIKRQLTFAPTAVGSVMRSAVEVLLATMTVADAIRRIERFKQSGFCDVFIVNPQHRLVGVLEVSALLTANHNAVLSTVMNPRFDKITAHSAASSQLEHAAWAHKRRLPVVDRNDILVGVLDHADLLASSVSLEPGPVPQDPLSNLMSVGGLYWVQAARMLVGMFGLVSQVEEKKR